MTNHTTFSSPFLVIQKQESHATENNGAEKDSERKNKTVTAVVLRVAFSLFLH
jgi:hypothetical protein